MCSTLPGDHGSRSCQSYCRRELAGRHCLHCTCSDCSFCAHQRKKPPPPPTTLERLQYANLSLAAVASVRKQFLGRRGVVLRLWECSLAGCLGDAHELGGNAFLQSCIRHELDYAIRGYGGGAQSPPASLLRWDVPAAIFAGGRCVEPVHSEWSLYPKPQVHDPLLRMDRDGWQRLGFVGHNVTQMGVGWVLGELATQRGGAFPHDAWTGSSQKSGTWEGANIEPCSRTPNATRGQPTAEYTGVGYAQARFSAMHGRSQSQGSMSPMQQLAAAYKWGVANSSDLNCYHWQWEEALAEQRAYALLFQSMPESQSWKQLRPECSIWDSLYNQVHASYNLSHIRGIFYVNDTITPRRLSEANHTKATRQRVIQASRKAADSALAVAQAAQRYIETEHGVTLPIIQYWFTADCFDPERLATRLAVETLRQEPDLGPGARYSKFWGDAQWTARVVFREPPEPLLEYFGAFFGRTPRAKRKRLRREYRWLMPHKGYLNDPRRRGRGRGRGRGKGRGRRPQQSV